MLYMSIIAETHTDKKNQSILNIDFSLLNILLQDKTTGKNIIWATDNYAKYGSLYTAEKEIKLELITGKNAGIIKPRIQKSKQEQQERVRQKGEVFTPSWVCNMQNNSVDDIWFNRKGVFNVEKEKSWETVEDNIDFASADGKTWQDYVRSTRLEITCGEAPYLTSRYDAVTGEHIEVKNRIGLLDRKLRIVSENCETRDEWITWATKATQSTYGYEWQGDNILIARENLLFTVLEHYEVKFGGMLEMPELVEFAKIIAWNIWQMDGLRFVVPNSCSTKEVIEQDLFESRVISKPCEGCKLGYGKKSYFKHNGMYCNIMNWETGKVERFADSLKGKK